MNLSDFEKSKQEAEETIASADGTHWKQLSDKEKEMRRNREQEEEKNFES